MTTFLDPNTKEPIPVDDGGPFTVGRLTIPTLTPTHPWAFCACGEVISRPRFRFVRREVQSCGCLRVDNGRKQIVKRNETMPKTHAQPMKLEAFGQSLTIREWATIRCLTSSLIRSRLARGDTPEQALRPLEK